MASHRPDITIFLMWVGGGGKETVVWHLARGFVDAGYKVDLVLGNAASEYGYKIPSCVRIVDLKTHGYLRTTVKLAFYLLRRRPRVLFSRRFAVAILASSSVFGNKREGRKSSPIRLD